MKILLPIFLLFTFSAQSQNADFILLKNHGRTIKTFFAGENIDFTTNDGVYTSGLISGIKNDTITIQQFIINYLPTTFGTYIKDTLGSNHYTFNYKEIKAIGNYKKAKFNAVGSAGALFSGGVLLTLASGAVYLFDREKFSSPLAIASAGLGALGYIWAKQASKGIVIGKKYKLEYLDMSNKNL